MPAKTDAPKRFELPALNFNFESLTAGTDIPPPPPSPKEEASTLPPVSRTATTPAAPVTTATTTTATTTPYKPVVAATATPMNCHGNGMIFSSPNSTKSNTLSPLNSKFRSPSSLAGSKRPAVDDVPLSPTSSHRPRTIRRLFSFTLLNHAYADEQGSTTSLGMARPDSRSNASVTDEKKSKRRSGWFQRLRNSDNGSKRSSLVLSAPEEPKKPTGPPPPMIPELRTVETKIDLGNAGTISDEAFFRDFK